MNIWVKLSNEQVNTYLVERIPPLNINRGSSVAFSLTYDINDKRWYKYFQLVDSVFYVQFPVGTYDHLEYFSFRSHISDLGFYAYFINSPSLFLNRNMTSNLSNSLLRKKPFIWLWREIKFFIRKNRTLCMFVLFVF